MEQKLAEITKENSPEAEEYFEFIKTSVDDGNYFKDALNWYFFRYVSPICDRTLLIFGAIISAIILFFLYQMIKLAFPLVEEVPIFITAPDQSLYSPSLIALKPKEGQENYDANISNVDAAVAKYLLSVYVKEREGYDFSDAKIEKVNKKFDYIRNLSSAEEYRIFQLVMSKDNPGSPIQSFGQDIRKTITIESVRLIKKEPQDLSSKALHFLVQEIPIEAEVKFLATIKTTDQQGIAQEEKEHYIAKINFAFEGVKKNQKGVLNFKVNKYKLFKVR